MNLGRWLLLEVPSLRLAEAVMEVLLTRIADAGAAAVWTEYVDRDAPFGMKAYEGRHKEWRFLVVSFSIEEQGFPKGARGHDGTATSESAIVRLPRELAERLYRKAETDAGPVPVGTPPARTKDS